MRCPYLQATLIFVLFVSVLGIPVPNGQLGNVEIECGEKTIEAVFLTEALFEGRIFVIGHAHDPKCVSRDTGRRTTSIVIDKNECGVVTTRSTEPNGLFSTVKLMISFHNDFVTKVDRGYEIVCFYMAGDKTVTYPITVNTPSLAGITEIAEMPRCRYEVIDPDTREPADVVTVGNKLLHRWVCESTAPDLWCMKVHSCRVEDGSGTEFLILDERGCSIDRYLLDNLEYGPGHLQAQKEAHAFKFADKVVVNFQCSVRLDIKDGECLIPECEDPLRAEQARRVNQASRVGPSAGFDHTTSNSHVQQQTTHRVVETTRAPQQGAHVAGGGKEGPRAAGPVRPVFRNPMRPTIPHPSQQRSTRQPTTIRNPTTRNPVHPVFRGPRHAGFVSEFPLDSSLSSIEIDVRSQQIDVLDPIFDTDRKSARVAEMRRNRRVEDCVPRGMFVLAASSSLALITLLSATVVVLLLRHHQKS